MVSMKQFIKKVLNVKDCVIEDVRLSPRYNEPFVIQIVLHPKKSLQKICPHCGRKCPGYDTRTEFKKWRAPDFNGIKVELCYKPIRVLCPVHGVVTAAVPWAFHDSSFTKDFDMISTFLAMNINKKVASEYLRVDWHTIGRCISRVRKYLEPNPENRLDGLVDIGIDETSFRKGHDYITTVIDHRRNIIVWAAEGHSIETLSKFFELLTPEQRASIQTVTGDGAKWIDTCIAKYIPHATRVIDAFHVVGWAQEALDKLKRDRWRDALQGLRELQADAQRKRGRPSLEDSATTKALNEAKAKVNNIKGSTYALGKAPENLTEKQKQKLEFIANTDKQLFRAYELKEQLRLILHSESVLEAKAELDSFFWRATHSRIPYFKELAYKTRRHEDHILNTIETGLSNARVESYNNKIKLFIRKAYGFRNIESMIDLIMLGCSNIFIPLPNRGGMGIKVA